ncbi:hypothetical protein OB962_12865 [Aeromonas piscicola]|uniref:HNH endonuclease n=1 Tax=Aeromonas piscicola TaxID=600645 RepID=A0ABT7QD40_9GAMM|nr:hypothetical protein [Aeromonas piscicola]MDM5131872.1 hypothetical protein [Aeromonas piscicola]
MYKFKINRAINITLSYYEILLCYHLNTLGYDSWSGKLPDSPRGTRAERDELKTKIKNELKKLNGEYCSYCGTSLRVLGVNYDSNSQRDHILPKEKYRHFTFEMKNIALACARCNGLDYKSSNDYCSNYNDNYDFIKTSIVHPYLDDIENHIEINDIGVACVLNNSEKAINTINEFDINDEALVVLRGGYLITQDQENKLSNADKNFIRNMSLRVYGN